ncbi:MAG: cytochrome c [Pseudohongiellaceae bacterium]
MKSGFLKTCLFLTFILSGGIAVAAEDVAKGAQLYRYYCMACHQAEGEGIANVFPALAGSEVVLGSAEDVALVVLNGRGGMPAFKGSISDPDLATIITHVRNSWGNDGAGISAQRVSELSAGGGEKIRQDREQQ